MSVIVKQVQNKKELKKFVEFQNKLYKGNEYFVPKIFTDELDTFNPKKNPAFEFCDCACFLAYKDGKIAGRVAAIVNRIANEKWNHKEVRYGWIDFIDDEEVSKALIDTVIQFGKERGMDSIAGPLGFTDFDPEGMLVHGFDQLCTMALIYNYPYYARHMEAMGFTKEVDWLEYKIYIPKEVPDRIKKVSKIVQERYNLNVRKITMRELKKEKLGRKIFSLVNETYGSLYNFTPLSDELIDKYVGSYLGLLDLEYVTLLEREGEIVGFAISVPSITKALQKCGGKLFPFGWYHVIKSLRFKHEEAIELLLVGVKPEYKGGLAVIFDDFIPRLNKGGFRFGETNAELESNNAMQNPWDMFENEYTKRRRIYKKELI